MATVYYTAATLDDASDLHAGRPTLVIVGAGATDLPAQPLSHILDPGVANSPSDSASVPKA